MVFVLQSNVWPISEVLKKSGSRGGLTGRGRKIGHHKFARSLSFLRVVFIIIKIFEVTGVILKSSYLLCFSGKLK